ncbi:hypothetical protein DLM75_09420 [Leptospira stimsonii]|uniref:Uncharacterized protein n=1 Tax=Leptospira stimsonii TaxID=2202203 RepID=A0A396ZAJ8_9LEPT|nr:hypothetical protein DLM75_09420 [Leptospira stimsonii]
MEKEILASFEEKTSKIEHRTRTRITEGAFAERLAFLEKSELPKFLRRGGLKCESRSKIKNPA